MFCDMRLFFTLLITVAVSVTLQATQAQETQQGGFSLPVTDSEIYSCLSGERKDCGVFTNQVTQSSIDLQCYRDCVEFCQGATDTIQKERNCIEDNCLEGGKFGC